MASIKAITFDLWDTLVHDDSDEPKRQAQGLLSKKAERRHLLWQALNEVQPIELGTVSLAYDVADAGFNMAWKENSINWRLEQRIRVILNGLGRSLSEESFRSLVETTGNMEVDIPPDAIEGAQAALEELAQQYQLAIVSDAIVTPGTGLRRLLEGHDLKRYFEGFAFSDEVGRSKPHRSMFESAAKQLGVKVTEIVHVGDRDHNDVKGPHAIGAKAVLFIATRDADRGITTADAICERHRDLPVIIDRLASE